MNSFSLFLCGWMALPGADPVTLGHEFDPALITPPTGQLYDPYGVYRQPQGRRSSPYHVIRQNVPRDTAVATRSPEMNTPPSSPYGLVRQIAPAPAPVAEPLALPDAVVELPVLPSVATPAFGATELLACAATVQASAEATVRRADFRLTGAPEAAIQQADLRLPDTAPPLAIKLVSVRAIADEVPPPVKVKSAPPVEVKSAPPVEVKAEPAVEVKAAPPVEVKADPAVYFPIIEWAADKSVFESALDLRQKSTGSK